MRVAAGVLSGLNAEQSGLVGIGSGILLFPALVFLLGLSQYQAQSTALALMVAPVGIVAAWAYWRQGYVDVRVSGFAKVRCNGVHEFRQRGERGPDLLYGRFLW